MQGKEQGGQVSDLERGRSTVFAVQYSRQFSIYLLLIVCGEGVGGKKSSPNRVRVKQVLVPKSKSSCPFIMMSEMTKYQKVKEIQKNNNIQIV